jgi:hypothetical protein
MRVRPPIDAGVSVALVAVDAAPAVVMPVDAAAPVIDAAPAPARVTFAFDTWCELVIDDLPRGRADREREVVLGPGRHRASCSQGPGLGAWSETVEVRAGQVRRVEGTLLAPVEVTIDAGDAVRISGQTIRSGDRIVLRPGRYRVEIVVGGRARAPVYVSIPRVARCTLRDRPAVDCYRP